MHVGNHRMCPGQHRDRLAQPTLWRQPGVQVSIDARDIGQGHRIGVIGLRPRHRVTLLPALDHNHPVGDGEGVDE
jgi:hypothetical protein